MWFVGVQGEKARTGGREEKSAGSERWKDTAPQQVVSTPFQKVCELTVNRSHPAGLADPELNRDPICV